MAVRMLTYLCILLFACFYCQAGAISCFNCDSHTPGESCLHYPTEREVTFCRHGCILERIYRHSRIIKISRRCYNKTLKLMKTPIFSFLNANTNKTVYTVRQPDMLLAANLCNKDYCNGPHTCNLLNC